MLCCFVISVSLYYLCVPFLWEERWNINIANKYIDNEGRVRGVHYGINRKTDNVDNIGTEKISAFEVDRTTIKAYTEEEQQPPYMQHKCLAQYCGRDHKRLNYWCFHGWNSYCSPQWFSWQGKHHDLRSSGHFPHPQTEMYSGYLEMKSWSEQWNVAPGFQYNCQSRDL